ncbi:MAG: NYN domain-containing protein [Candidatus Sedimenticola sp. (ex Thyasira tokunagai)]
MAKTLLLGDNNSVVKIIYPYQVINIGRKIFTCGCQDRKLMNCFLILTRQTWDLQYLGERAFYYTSLTGSLEDKNSVEESLHNLGFNPKVFLKTRQEEKSKGVDVHLTTDILSNAYLNNYDVALIVTGDADFIPAIEEVKRLGKIVYVCFFTGKENGLSPRLSLTSDKNINITGLFEKVWREWKSS